jgi:hypothetical protein
MPERARSPRRSRASTCTPGRTTRPPPVSRHPSPVSPVTRARSR